MLGKYAQAHGFPQLHAATGWAAIAAEQTQQGGFPRAVVTHDAHPVIPQQGIGEVADQRPSTQLAAQMLTGENLFAQAAGNALDFQLRLRGRLPDIFLQGFKAVDAALGLGAPARAPR